MKPYKCRSQECLEKAGGYSLSAVQYHESPDQPCNVCGQKGTLTPCEITHLIQPHKEGIIRGVNLAGMLTGVRWEFLCEKSRRGFRASPQSPQFPRSYTALPSAATCHDCLLEFGSKIITQPRKS